MTILYVISIKDVISSRLVSSNKVLDFFKNELTNIVVDNVVVDFAGVESISRSFAYQYLTSKLQSKGKKIREISVPNNINAILKSELQTIEVSNQVIVKNKERSRKTNSLIVKLS
ncbi:hypothetical protein BH23THE1_BH23THE1_36160 [soil metagenome]